MASERECVVNQKRMFKVICPVEKRSGQGKYWMRVGNAFVNKDESINVYLDAVPTMKDFTLQLRELTEDELRERAEKRETYQSRGAINMPTSAPSTSADHHLPF